MRAAHRRLRRRPTAWAPQPPRMMMSSTSAASGGISRYCDLVAMGYDGTLAVQECVCPAPPPSRVRVHSSRRVLTCCHGRAAARCASTSEHLVGLALLHASTPSQRAHGQRQWEELAAQKQHAIEDLLGTLPTAAEAKWSRGTLEKFISDLEIREHLANRRLAASGVIAGVRPESIMLSAGNIVPRDGVKDVLGQLCCGAGDFIGAVQVISNNLSDFLCVRARANACSLPVCAGSSCTWTSAPPQLWTPTRRVSARSAPTR